VSDVTAGAVLTLVIPLGMLVLVIALWIVSRRWLRLGGRGADQGVATLPPEG
jgi:hypothetical protein